jgi:TM2 domain-containing membrane protein YozV
MLQCPHCRNGVDDAPDLAGQLVHCPFCRGQFQMPSVAAVASILSQPAYRPTRERGPQNSPGVAAVLSFIFVGLGQIYNGQIGKGLLMIAGYVACLVVTFLTAGLAFPLPLLFWIWGMADAYAGAEIYNRRWR